MNHKLVRRGLIALALVLVGIQLVRPARTNPPVAPANTLSAQVDVPPPVDAIFNRACADCHSHRTRWPWYSEIAPVSWLLTHHVNDGRQKMNLDSWDDATSFKDICREVQSGAMPMKGYLILHPDATLSPQDVQAVCAWTQRASGR
ncbi:MAG: heme-binding domain-containing protein [Bryobacterales bacterium]|nr:heme-binding domain-containing protein [Bryobacterales bacterium]